MRNLILILKGFIIGIGKVIPGVSGSLMAISLGVYEKSIQSISNLLKDFKNSAFYLGSLGIGIIIAVIFGSRIILCLLNKNYFITMFFIIGLILGSSIKRFNTINKNNFIIFIIPFILLFFLNSSKLGNNFIPENNFKDYLIIFLLGILEAATMIIPGISGTAIYILLGVYNFILDVFSNPISIYFILFAIGLFIGVLIVSKLMNYLLKKYNYQINLIITSLMASSILFLFKDLFSHSFNLLSFIIGIILFVNGFLISFIFDR